MRTLIKLLVAFSLISLISAAAQPSIRTSATDASGTFSIHGTPDPAFANIQVIEIAGNDEYGWKASPPFFGFIRLTNRAQTDYKLLKPTVNDKHISFKTQSVAGVSYEFEGNFISLDFAEKDMRNQTVLSGTLKRLTGGKVMAEAKLDFDYTPGG
jgi:hypothetical protein